MRGAENIKFKHTIIKFKNLKFITIHYCKKMKNVTSDPLYKEIQEISDLAKDELKNAMEEMKTKTNYHKNIMKKYS